MNPLQTTIQSLSSDFAHKLLIAFRSASFEDVLETSKLAATNGHTVVTAVPAKSIAAAAAKKTAAPAKKAAAPVASDKRIRRTAEDISEGVDQIVSLLQKHPDGLRSENIREELEMERKFLPKLITEALASKRITKSGEKRATLYKVRPVKGAKAAAEAAEDAVN